MREELQKKVNTAIKLIKSAVGNQVVEVSYSGGKDSEVILELTKMSGVKYRPIYKNTTIDPPGTIKHVKSKGVEIMKPKITFLELIEMKGMPTRRARFCCEKLKEYKILDIAIQGIRREESDKRAKRYNEDDPIICRIYNRKSDTVNIILPILSWTNEDVKEFIEDRKIQCHPLYYDENGIFHPERRLGCMGCPLKSDNGRSEYKKYPKLFKQVVKRVKKWWDNHPDANSRKKFRNVYGLIAHNLYFNSYEKWRREDTNLFGQKDWKGFLEKEFGVKLEE